MADSKRETLLTRFNPELGARAILILIAQIVMRLLFVTLSEIEVSCMFVRDCGIEASLARPLT